METGYVIYNYISQPGDMAIFAVDERHLIIYNFNNQNSILYDASEKREIWNISSAMTEPTLDGDILFAMIDGIPSAVNWVNRTLLWNIEKNTGDIVYIMDDFAVDYPVWLDSYSRNGLIVKSGDQLYIGSTRGVFSSISMEGF